MGASRFSVSHLQLSGSLEVVGDDRHSASAVGHFMKPGGGCCPILTFALTPLNVVNWSEPADPL